MEDTVRLYCANAGDARIVLGHHGQATRLTKDHRPDDPDEIARIEQAGGFMFKGRVVGVLAITRSLGDHCMKSFVIGEPYCSETCIRLEEEERQTGEEKQEHDTVSTTQPSFLICACDGLWDVFQDQEAVDFVKQYQLHYQDREKVAEFLVHEAVRKGSTDNVSVIVAWL
jgi:serine/threonine protein phosphatase PrpC